MGRKESDHSVSGFSMPEKDYQEFEKFVREHNYTSRQAALNEAIKLLMTDKMREVLPEQAAKDALSTSALRTAAMIFCFISVPP